MALLVVGLSHKTAPLELREALALDEARSLDSYKELSESGLFRDLVLLSTCNRVEAYAWAADAQEAEKILKAWLESLHPDKKPQVRKSLQVLGDDEALWHLMQVASSLDSMVLGEAQILGQVKLAYEQAVAQDTVGSFFHGLFQKVFAAAKEVRSSTELGRYPASVPSIAVSLAERLFGDLGGKSALLVGAGEMSELTADYLKSAGVQRLVFCNRSLPKAKDLAKHFSGEALGLDRLEDGLAAADIVVFSTSAPSYLMTPELAQAALKKRQGAPSFMSTSPCRAMWTPRSRSWSPSTSTTSMTFPRWPRSTARSAWTPAARRARCSGTASMRSASGSARPASTRPLRP